MDHETIVDYVFYLLITVVLFVTAYTAISYLMHS